MRLKAEQWLDSAHGSFDHLRQYSPLWNLAQTRLLHRESRGGLGIVDRFFLVWWLLLVKIDLDFWLVKRVGRMAARDREIQK
jgi:hypothetical protein